MIDAIGGKNDQKLFDRAESSLETKIKKYPRKASARLYRLFLGAIEDTLAGREKLERVKSIILADHRDCSSARSSPSETLEVSGDFATTILKRLEMLFSLTQSSLAVPFQRALIGWGGQFYRLIDPEVDI
jgi:hypothetical protein